MSTTTAVKPKAKVEAWPVIPIDRFLLRAVLIAPFILLSVLLMHVYAGNASPNQILFDTVNKLNFGDTSLSWISKLDPLLPSIVAAIVRVPLIMSLLSAVLAGVFLHSIMELLHQRRIPLSIQVVIIAAIALNPLFIYQATQNFALFLGITAFSVALIHIVRFIEMGSTYHGVAAGSLIPVSVLADHNGFIYGLILLAIVPVLRWWRKGERGAGYATVAVIFFPTIVSVVSVVIVDWVVARYNPTGTFIRFGTPDKHLTTFATGFFSSSPWYAIIVPLILVAIACLFARRFTMLFVSLLAVGIEVIGYYYGFSNPTRIGVVWFTVISIYLSFAGHTGKKSLMWLGAGMVVLLNIDAYLIAFNAPYLMQPLINYFS